MNYQYFARHCSKYLQLTLASLILLLIYSNTADGNKAELDAAIDPKTLGTVISRPKRDKVIVTHQVIHISIEQEETAINHCVTQIISGEYQSAVEEFKKVNTDSALIRIVQDAYDGNANYLGKVLDFLGYITSGSQIYAGYSTLLDEMDKYNQLYNSEIIRLAYRVKEATEQSWYVTASTKLKKSFKSLKNSIPRGIRNLAWNSNCTIRDINYNEYLYVFFDDDDSGDRAVYTWKPSKPFIEGLWDLKPVNNENNVQFHIRNIGYDGYQLVQKTDSDIFEWESTSYRRNVHAATRNSIKSKSSGYHSLWEIEPVFVNDKLVYKIRNPSRNEYLYAASDEFKPAANTRRVFTWISDGPSSTTAYWDIKCNVKL